jgi:predicted O-linked N-acetylglucosamine transferase (SPINDLY family)
MVRVTTQAARRAASVDTSTPIAASQFSDAALADVEMPRRTALLHEPRNRPDIRRIGITAYQSGRHTEALALLSTVCDDAGDYSNLGIVLHALGRDDEAEAAYRQAIALDASVASAHCNLGNLLQEHRRNAEATSEFRIALELRPDFANAWSGLGHSLHRQGQLSDAVNAFRSAVQFAPASAEAHSNLGTLLFALEHNEDARVSLTQAITLDPDYAKAHGNLGALYARCGCPVAAEASSRAAIALAPEEHRWLTNLGVALFAQGRHKEAESCYRQALAMRPDYASGHGNLLFALSYRTDISPEAVFAEYQEWDRRHASHLASTALPFALDRTAGRRLRVGYVSPDFRQHAVALFAEPLLAAHDRSDVELYCYSDVAAQDAATARFQSLADHWRSTLGLDDAELAETIRADQIDVLVDLAGHSAGNRLLTFARRPAPVQVAYLLGHGYTTGLSAMDVFLADAILAPDGADALFSERIVRLPRIPLAYAPPDAMPPVAPLPAVANGFVTFGHFGRAERLNDTVIETWARILHAVPGSRLMLNNRPYQEAAFRAAMQARFARHGITADRLDLVYTTPQREAWAAYGGIDIALDPFPHNAGTTTIEALWQGVPVVTLADRPTIGRFGASILHAVGLDDWVATNIDDYIARATTAAGDLASLKDQRDGLRQRFAASPLRDATDLARTVEAAYRALWDEWREGDTPRLHRLYTQDDLAGAEKLAHRMLQRDPADTEAHHVLGLLDYRKKRFKNADSHFQAAIAQAPQRAELHANHAAVLRSLGRLVDAEATARTALKLEPQQVGAQNNLGNILRDVGRYDESAACYRAAVSVQPYFTDAWVNLAWVLALAGHARQAEKAAQQAIACDPGNADGHNNLGLALMRQGRLAEAEAALRQALALRPDFALPHSNILFCLNYRPELSAEAIFAEYQEWDRRHAKPLMPAEPIFELDRTPGRKLHVGYVSPDFRQHAVALFAEPLLAAHDRASVELYCYAEVPAPDAVTDRFRALADHWRSTIGLSDEDLAALIRRDRIDVLVDMAGHTAGNRLLVFARKPAPVQVTYLLGHGYSSGLSAMDAFLADAALAPTGADSVFSESLVRLSRIPLTYAPPADMPDVAALPARANGFVTFGYFGRTVRLNDAVVAAWAQILHAVPGSRLMLNSSPFSEPAGCEQIAARFASHGITPSRLELICTSPQPLTWAAYGSIDIALDPFPHNAGTTTIEALWQGVPVVSLAGRPTVGRFGAAILHAVGLDDWVTTDVDAYVARAIAAASDPDALAQLRATLRPRFAASPLCDAGGLAHEVETAYRELWNVWREGETPRLQRLYETGDLSGAHALAERMLARNSAEAFALHVLGVLRFNAGDTATATEFLQRSIDAKPDASVLSDLGVTLRGQGRYAESEAAYRRALELDPSLVPALGNLGNVLLDQHKTADAESALTLALTHAPNQPWLLRSLALCLMARGVADQAETALRQALVIAPADAEAHETLGALLGQSGRPVEAEAHHRAALPTLKERARGLSNLAIALQMQGRLAETEQCFREALAVQPDYVTAHGNLLFALNYRNDLTADAIFAEYRNWDHQHAVKLAPKEPRFAIDHTTGRRLRVGYVSSDFRQHSVALFAEPLLAAHDHAAIELFCYAEVAVPDSVTDQFRGLADHWRSTVGLSDAAVADMIRQDRIDVLVDLAGHTGGNRLLVFARKPAPVQVAYLLGHGYSTGLSAMDGFLADDRLAPPGAETLFSERLMRLPRIPLAYAPPDGMPPVGPLAAERNGFVAFGYFGRPERLNDDVISAWARILLAVPGSRLVLNTKAFGEVAFRALFVARFAAQGIQRERLDLICTETPSRTWAAYGGIDIALDPFPHNAGTTTIEALWLGVPVVSLAGRPSVGRFGAMILHAVGLDDWVCHDIDGYIARCVAAAADLPALATLRAELQPRMQASPLCDATGLARCVEAAYRTLWDDWRSPLPLPPPTRGGEEETAC